MKERKMIFNSYLARQLLLNGFPIIDLVKNSRVNNATIFIFEDTDKLREKIKEITNND